jgi:hypothetical protein
LVALDNTTLDRAAVVTDALTGKTLAMVRPPGHRRSSRP